MTLNELRTKRARALDAAKAFIDSHTDERGILSEADDATYNRMEKEIIDLGKEITRMEKLETMDREMSKPTSAPLTAKPEAPKPEAKSGRATDSYSKAFWNQMRSSNVHEFRNELRVGSDTEGGYLVPDTFEKTLVDALNDTLHFRKLAHTFRSASGAHKIPVVTSHATASWVDEATEIPETTETYGQKTIGAHKLSALIKVSEELLNDSAFDLEAHFRDEFVTRMAETEEAAFINGDGNGKPYGILHDTEGAEVGITTASATAITADELINLFYSLRAPYRHKAVWLLNDATIAQLRLLKDNNGQYIWQPGLKEGEPDRLLGRPVYTSPYMPTVAAGAKAIAFGDLKHYWIGDREGISFRRLSELYATKGQVGFLAIKRLDGRTILPEGIKLLKVKGTATTT